MPWSPCGLLLTELRIPCPYKMQIPKRVTLGAIVWTGCHNPAVGAKFFFLCDYSLVRRITSWSLAMEVRTVVIYGIPANDLLHSRTHQETFTFKKSHPLFGLTSPPSRAPLVSHTQRLFLWALLLRRLGEKRLGLPRLPNLSFFLCCANNLCEVHPGFCN